MPISCEDCDGFPPEPDYTCPLSDIADGDSVDAETTNKPLQDLASRTDYLKCLIESLDFTTGHFISDVTFDASVAVGNVVYYDTSQTVPVYNKAFVGVTGRDIYDHEDGVVRTLDSAIADSSYVLGVVTSIGSENTICVGGTFRSRNFDATLIDNLIGDSSSDDAILGQYYLSNSDATSGTVQKDKPPLGVPTCFIALDETGETGEYIVTVNPQLHDLLLAHRHYSFDLQARPATALPIGYNSVSPGSHTTLDTDTYPVGTSVDVYLYKWSGNACLQSVSGTYARIGIATFAGNDTNYGALLVDFQPNRNYLAFIKEEEECIGVTSGPTNTFEAYLRLWDRGGFLTEHGDVTEIGDIHAGFMEDLEAGVDSSGGTITERSPVYRDDDNNYIINEDLLLKNLDWYYLPYQHPLSGWCPCVNNPTDCPDGAAYYYDWPNDSVLSEVWPPYPVASTVIFVNGALVNTSKLSINNEGIFWFDDEDPPFSVRFPDVPAPSGGEWNDTGYGWGDILPYENILFYAVIASNTDEVVVRSLTPADGSVITIKDANGNSKVSGDLIINAEFELSDDSPADGAYVVKDIEGFAVKKGYVVERVKSGPLITVQSTIVGGQGEITISAADFGGIREDEPDLFFADDIVVERHKDIFYKVFPSSRQSSLTGKVFIPTFLPTDSGEEYSITILGQFMTPSSGSNLALPDLSVDYKVVSNSMTTLYEGSSGNIDTDDDLVPSNLVLGTGYNQYGYIVKAVASDVEVTPGDTFMFKIIRDGVADASAYKVGLLDIRYQISKSN